MTRTVTLQTFLETVVLDRVSESYTRRLDIGLPKTVPNGGYVASVMLSAAKAHFNGPLEYLHQPDVIIIHLEYVRRTSPGPAIIKIRSVKLGSAISIIHLSLSQGSRNEVEGYTAHTNLSAQNGLTLPVASSLSPHPLPANLKDLAETGEDQNWALDPRPPFIEFRHAAQHLAFYHPRHGQIGPHNNFPKPILGVVDQWIQFCPGGVSESFTTESLGFVVDMFPLIVEQFFNHDGQSPRRQTRWYPTMIMNLDIKKAFPLEGFRWLFVRARATQILKGKMDLQVTVLDETGDLVALASHVNLIVDAERNLAKRTHQRNISGGKI